MPNIYLLCIYCNPNISLSVFLLRDTFFNSRTCMVYYLILYFLYSLKTPVLAAAPDNFFMYSNTSLFNFQLLQISTYKLLTRSIYIFLVNIVIPPSISPLFTLHTAIYVAFSGLYIFMVHTLFYMCFFHTCLLTQFINPMFLLFLEFTCPRCSSRQLPHIPPA